MYVETEWSISVTHVKVYNINGSLDCMHFLVFWFNQTSFSPALSNESTNARLTDSLSSSPVPNLKEKKSRKKGYLYSQMTFIFGLPNAFSV